MLKMYVGPTIEILIDSKLINYNSSNSKLYYISENCNNTKDRIYFQDWIINLSKLKSKN